MEKKMNDSVKRSRKLAYILRHDNRSPLDIGGWLRLDYLISKGFSIDEIKEIINTDSKHRFEFSKSGNLVRALYGHSVNVELNLVPSEPPMFLWHGSVSSALASITEEGIMHRSRQYVHLTNDWEAAIDTGARHGEPVSVLVVAGKMYDDGYKFYRVTDNVWLTKHVPTKYIIIQHSNMDL